MSAEAFSWVVRNSPYNGTALIIHLLIGDVANDQYDYHFFMTNTELATKARCTRQTVNQILNQMVEDGFLEVVGKDEGKAVRYAFVFKSDAEPVYVPRRERVEGVSGNPTGGVVNPDRGVSGNPTGGVGKSDTELKGNSSEEPNEELNPAEKLQKVWEAYVETCQKVGVGITNPQLTHSRRQLILRRLKNHSVDELILAVTGWQHSPFHRGENDDGKVWNAIELLLRNEEKIEQFIGYHSKPASKQSISEAWGRDKPKIASTTISNDGDWDD